MIISFFSSDTYTTWVDYSSHPDLVYQDEIEINLSTHRPRLIQTESGYSIEVIENITEETLEQKRARVKKLFIEANEEDISTDILEWEVFSWQELGDMLNQRLCWGNIYKEMQLHREILDIFIPHLLMQYHDIITESEYTRIMEIKNLSDKVKNLIDLF